MSTRTRIMLQHEGSIFSGSPAVAVLIRKVLSNDLIRFHFPLGWEKMSKREKLLTLAHNLPLGSVLHLFQEPRRTRKKKSLYWKMRESESQVYPPNRPKNPIPAQNLLRAVVENVRPNQNLPEDPQIDFVDDAVDDEVRL